MWKVAALIVFEGIGLTRVEFLPLDYKTTNALGGKESILIKQLI